jgi:hypothetical protein
VFLLAGQSNMDGDGETALLTDPTINDDPRLTGVQEDVQIWWTGAQGDTVTNHEWWELYPGMAVPEAFGAEITIGRRLADTLGEDVYLLKVSKGGTSMMYDWKPGGYCHQTLAAEVALGLQALRDAGLDPVVKAMFWHQGETDSIYGAYAAQYLTNLRDFIPSCRTIAENPDMPFILGELGAIYPHEFYPYRATVVAAQNFVVTGPDPVENTHIFATDDLGLKVEYSGGTETGVHYDTAGYLELGYRFADAYLATIPEPATVALLALGGILLLRRRRR